MKLSLRTDKLVNVRPFLYQYQYNSAMQCMLLYRNILKISYSVIKRHKNSKKIIYFTILKISSRTDKLLDFRPFVYWGNSATPICYTQGILWITIRFFQSTDTGLLCSWSNCYRITPQFWIRWIENQLIYKIQIFKNKIG